MGGAGLGNGSGNGSGSSERRGAARICCRRLRDDRGLSGSGAISELSIRSSRDVALFLRAWSVVGQTIRGTAIGLEWSDVPGATAVFLLPSLPATCVISPSLAST